MGGAVVLDNSIGADWVRMLHVMADRDEMLDAYLEWIGPGAKVERFADDLRIHHLKASWLVRGPVILPSRGMTIAVLWWIGQDRVSKAMVDAGVAFALATNRDPEFALIQRIPKGVEEFVEVDGITLMQDGRVPVGFLAVYAGGMQTTDATENRKLHG